MKKLIFTFVCIIAGLAMAQAQTETLTLKAVKKGEEPAAVMNAIKHDFPKAIVDDLRLLPAKLYGEQWSVNLQGDLGGNAPDSYLVNMKIGNENYKAVYDKAGKLISSKTIIKEAALPSEITKTISSKYPSWKIENDRERISYKKGSLKEAYHVQIHQSNRHRSLFFDGTGKILKDKLMVRSS